MVDSAREVVGRDGEHLFSHFTNCINLIHTAINFYQDIPCGYLVMPCAKTTLEIYQRDVIPKKK